MTVKKMLTACILVFLTGFILCPFFGGEDAEAKTYPEIRVDFTGNMEGNLDIFPEIAAAEKDLKKKKDAVFFFDGGNYTNQLPYKMVTSSAAPGLRLLQASGYDGAALGESELALGEKNLINMMDSLKQHNSGESALLLPNLKMSRKLRKNLQENGAEEYRVISRAGRRVAVFSVLGKEAVKKIKGGSFSCINASDYADRALKEIREKEKRRPDITVCLTSMTDAELRTFLQRTPGLDLVINTRGKVSEAYTLNGTEVAATGTSGKLCEVIFKKERENWSFYSYKAVTFSGKEKKDENASFLLEELRNEADEGYFLRGGFRYDNSLTENSVLNGDVRDIAGRFRDDPYGNLIADAYRSAFLKYGKQQECGNGIISLVSSDSVYGSIVKGDITAEAAFKVMAGHEGEYEKNSILIGCYLTGEEAAHLAEMNSENKKSRKGSRFSFGGIRYTYSPHRVKGARVYDVKVQGADGKWRKLRKKSLYLVLGDRKSLREMSELSFQHSSILAIRIRDKYGRENRKFTVLRQRNNDWAMRSWSAFAKYLKDEGITGKYRKGDGRIRYSRSASLSTLMREPNGVMWFGIGLMLIVFLIVFLFFRLIRLIIRSNRELKEKEREEQDDRRKDNRGNF